MESSDVYKRAVELLDEEGWEATFRRDYSGRGMYGSTVPAIVTDAPGPVVGGAVYAAALEFSCEMLPAFREFAGLLPEYTDSMGLSSRVYY